jgi:integrase
MAQDLDFKKRTIDALPLPAAGRAEYKDTKAPGLYLRVSSTGSKSFSFVGRAKGSSRPERLTLGKYPVVTPDQARTRAIQLAGKLSEGTSVAAADRERRGELTVDQLSAKYLAHLEMKRKRPDLFLRNYDLYIAPFFGKRRLSEVSAKDVMNWHDRLPGEIVARRAAQAAERQAAREQRRREIVARQAALGRKHGPDPKPREPTEYERRVTGHRTANSALESLRAMLNWAKRPKVKLFSGENPASSHDMHKQNERERFLLPSELPAFFESMAVEPSEIQRDCVLMKLLTGARSENVQAMRWKEVDLNERQWRIPETKNGKPQTVPLGEEAMELLAIRKDQNPKSAFVFPSDRSATGHVVNTNKTWRRVLQRAGIDDLRQHDLRRTMGSWQLKTGASLILIGRSLNQTSLHATKVYARLDLDPVRQSMERATSAIFQAAGLGSSADVIELPVPGKKAKKA